jgi:hypothetical protein
VNELNCFSPSTRSILKAELKTGGGDRFDARLLTASATLFQSSPPTATSTLRWSSKDVFVVELATSNHLFDVYIFKREQAEQELVLLKKLESVMAYQIVRRASNNNFYLIYSKYMTSNVSF